MVHREARVRFYDFRCRSCGTARTLAASSDPGPQTCGGCRSRDYVRYWRSRPGQPFEKPDTTGMKFGPTAAELAETGRPNTRLRDDAESMSLDFKAPEVTERAHEQLGMFDK